MSSRSEPRAELRVIRLLTVGVGLTCVLLLALRPSTVWHPAPMPDWFGPAQLLSLLVPVAVGAGAPWLEASALRRANAVSALTSLALVPMAILLNAALPAEDRHLPWLLTSFAPSAVASLIAWGPRAAWWLLGATMAGTQVTRLWSNSHTPGAGVNDIQALLTAITILALCGVLLSATRDADRTSAAARANEARRSAEAARREAREHAAALVHDEVLATLLLAARASGAAMHGAAVTAAARAARLIRELAESEQGTSLSAERWIAQLREATGQEDPTARLEISTTGSLSVPTEVAAALLGALRQALANSVAHAGDGAHRVVRIEMGDDTVRVRVHDDGVGFDPAALPRARMGVAVSILGRVQSLPGGSAQVDSQPGLGTTVTLRWARTPSDARSPVGDPERWLHPHPPAPPPTWATTRHRGLPLLAVFVAGQVGLATLATVTNPDAVWRTGLALVGVLTALGLIWGRSLSLPGLLRSGAAVAVLTCTAALSWAASLADRLDYADLWHLTSGALILVVLAVRGRPGLAVLGVLLSSAVVLAGIAVARPDTTEAAHALARALVNVLVGALLIVGIRKTHATTVRLEAMELARLHTRSWEEARQAELVARSRDLESLIGRMLERIATGRPLGDADRRECIALEGRLRDHYRGGRLSRSPMIEAAMAARIRGVDVCLLDDARHPLSEQSLELIACWMRDQLDQVSAGQFTGRILPSGRVGVASVVAGETSVVLDPRTRMPVG